MKTLVVDKKRYLIKRIVHNKGDDTFVLTPYDSAEYDKIVNDIVQAVKHTVDPEEAVKQALTKLEWEEVLNIHKILMKGKQKPKSSKGCYQITIGRHTIPMVD